MSKKKELPKLPRGMGSYEYVGEKIRFRKQITENGKKINLCVTGSTISECNTLMKQKELDSKKEIKKKETYSKTKTLEQGMEDWLFLYKINDVQNRSFDRIESSFTNHIKDTDFGRLQEISITSDDIQKHLNSLKNKKTKDNLSYSSKKKVYELLSQYFNYRYAKEPNNNPMISVKKPKRTEEETLNNEELIIWNDDEIKTICDIAVKPYLVGKSGFKHGCGILFIMWTFMRVGEAQALQWKDVNLEDGTVKISKSYSRIRKRNTKSNKAEYEYIIAPTKGKKTRQFKMCQMALDSITEYKKRKNPSSDDEYIFASDNGSILTEESLIRGYDGIKKEAGFKKHVTMHGLRHTGISYFLRHGVPVEVVSRMAGHQSVQITIDTYYQVLDEQKIKAIDDLNKYGKIDILK